jgi:uncharacterized membrane protein YcaP (DUF421 family)
MSWIEITYRVLFSFVVLLIMTRLMGISLANLHM